MKSKLLDELYKQYESAREMLSTAYSIGASKETLNNLFTLVENIESRIVEETKRIEKEKIEQEE